MKFGEIVEQLRDGKQRAARKGWIGKNMFIYVEPGKVLSGLREPLSSWLNKSSIEVLPHFNMYTADGKLISGWLASQTDMLADDWDLVF